MIVVDSSVIVAVLLDEPERLAILVALASDRARMSALNVFESETVIRRHLGEAEALDVRALLAANDVEITPFDDHQAQLANAAYVRFGKGIHPARLNLCDCAAYALAKSLDAPLLYKGDDFAQTDIASALTTG